MAKIPDNYVAVKDRVIAFRQAHPHGIINTKYERSGEHGEIITFVASIFKSRESAQALAPLSLADATGHSEIEGGDEKVLEKCETVAIGRALALLGFDLAEGIASKEEMDNYNESKSRSSRGDRKSVRKSKATEEQEEDEVEINDEEDEDEEEQEEQPKSRKSFRRRGR